MSILHGRDLIITDDEQTVIIGGARSCELTKECEVNEVTSRSNGSYKHHKSGKKGWKVTISHFIQALDDVLPKVGNTYELFFYIKGKQTAECMGNAICQQCTITSTVGNLSQGNIVFVGDGALT